MSVNIVFDLDNTIYFKIEPFIASLQELEYFKLRVEYEKMYTVFSKYSDYYFDKHDLGEIDFETMRVLRIQRTMVEFDIPMSKREAREWQKVYERFQYQIKLSEEIVQAFDFIKDMGWKIALITNGPTKHQMSKIESLGLSEWFEPSHIIISESFGVSKPNQSIFKEMERRLGIGKYYYVGDDYVNDVLGAISAGWKSIWITQNKQKCLASYCVENHKALVSLLTILEKVENI